MRLEWCNLRNPCRTTDVFSPDHLGPYTELHLLVCTLHADMSRTTSSGSVATFTSERPFAQADELTSHMNENTTVTMKSWGAQRKHVACIKLLLISRTVLSFKELQNKSSVLNYYDLHAWINYCMLSMLMSCLLIFSNSMASKEIQAFSLSKITLAHNKRSAVVFTVLVLEKDVDHSGQQGVQKGKDSNGDEELCWGGKVSNQVKPLLSPSLTHRHVKFHPVQPSFV